MRISISFLIFAHSLFGQGLPTGGANSVVVDPSNSMILNPAVDGHQDAILGSWCEGEPPKILKDLA